MVLQQYTQKQFLDLIDEQYGVELADETVIPQVNGWLGRGDGVAVYENHDLGHPEQGDKRLASYGSRHALLETEVPPQTLPDTPHFINWRYQLIGVYRGEPIERKVEGG